MNTALSSSSSLVAPKVLPGAGSESRADTAGELFPAVPFGEALVPLLQPAHYGPQDLLACTSSGGGGQVIFVYDMNSTQLVQTLQGHAGPVTAVLWKLPKPSYQQHRLFLLSGDVRGDVLLWDVAEGVVLSRLSVPCHQPIRVLSLVTDQHLLLITHGANSYVWNAHLMDAVTLPPAPLPLRCKEGPRPTVRLATSKLSPHHTSVLIMGDRARIISHIDPAKDTKPTARDLIYDSEDGEVTIVDAFFSEAAEEVLYFALPSAVGSYDWKVGMVLDEQILWTCDGVGFTRIFPSSANSLDDEREGGAIPLLYSLTTDQRLTAWYVQRTGKFTAVAADVRGARITTKGVATVSQSDADPTLFAVLFEDGSIAKWHFSVRCRRWRLMHYYGCPVQRPTCFCRAGGSSMVCCALESGHVAVMDARHSVALKRVNLVYSGGTRIILLCPHKHDDAVWIVSNRVVDGRNHHQVSLLDVRSGEVVRILRKPLSTAEHTKAKDISMDPTSTYLLLSFWNGTFEVWNSDDGRLLHMHSGLGVASVSWAPSSLRRCLTGVQGRPQLLSVVFSEGTMSLWSVHKDRCVVSRDAVPLLNANSIMGGSVQSVAVGSHLVLFDSTGVGFAIGAKGTRLSSHRLKDVPPAVGAVRCIAGNTPPPPTPSSFASFDVFANDSISAASPSSSEAAGAGGYLSCAAVVFADFSFGVWHVTTGDCLGLSTSSASAAVLRDVVATQVLWLDDSVAVLCQRTGTVLVLDKRLSVVNSSVSARALRRSMQNPSFLLPTQRTYLQASLELLLPEEQVPYAARDGAFETGRAHPSTDDGVEPGPTTDSTAADPSASASPSSPLTSRVAAENRPCRGPFGQLLDDGIRTLQEEMALYRRTMLPCRIAKRWSRAAADGDMAAAAFWTARWLGQREKQRFWALVQRATCPVSSLRRPLSAPDRVDDTSEATPYFLADPLTLSCAPEETARGNRLALSELRARTLQSANGATVDGGKARLHVARDFLKLGEPAKAVDVLLECSFEDPRFDQLSTLALAVAAGAAVVAGNASADNNTHDGHARGTTTTTTTTPSPPRPNQTPSGTGGVQASAAVALFTLSTKRAAAMLLAAGEVDAAVEKFVLAGEYNEACRALESQGRWYDAAALTKISPIAPAARRAILQRWAQQCAKYDAAGVNLAGSRILVSQGMLMEALDVLSSSSQFADVAGLLAVILADKYPCSLAASNDAAGEGGALAAVSTTQQNLLFNVLADYSSMLSSMGSRSGEMHVLGKVAALKLAIREAAGRPHVSSAA